MQQALTNAESAMEGKAAGTDEFNEANKALEEARKKFNRGESQAAQMEQDLFRQENQLYRESEREGIRTELDEARGQKHYFDDVIQYYNAKLAFFDALEGALNLEDEEDYNFFMQIQPEKDHLWNMLDSLHAQLYDVESHISNLEYDEFAMENRFAQEDEQAAMDDQMRQQEWLDEVNGEVEALEQELNGLKDDSGEFTEGNDQLGGQLQDRLDDLIKERDGIADEIAKFIQAQTEQKELQAKKEKERAEKAEQERREREAEQEKIDDLNRQKEWERTKAEITDINKHISSMKGEIKEKQEQQNKATDGKQFQKLDSEIRNLQDAVEAAVDYRENVLKPYRADLKAQREEAEQRAADRKAEEEAETLRKNLEKVEKLADQEEELAYKKEDMEFAKELMDRYAAEFDEEGNLKEDQELPWDWSEDLMYQYEAEFYAAKDVYQKMNKDLEGTRKIKEEVDKVKQE